MIYIRLTQINVCITETAIEDVNHNNVVDI